MATYHVIRHKPTLHLLPARVRATHYNFNNPEGAQEPRLFTTERAAKNCATCWAQGVWVQERVTEQDGWESPSYQYLDAPKPMATVEGRKREDLEVLPVSLEFIV
jgi:hypothetical protein